MAHHSRQAHHHRLRPRRLHGRDLRRPRHAGAGADLRLPARRPADDHDRRRELPGLRRRHPGPLADGADAPPGRARRHAHDLRPHRQGRSRRRARSASRAIPATTYGCDALIIATGAQAKWLGLPSEAKFQGFGVSACATCDGFFFRGKEVVVVGGGNTAVEEALYLANLASKVTVVHRRDAFRAERILQDRLFRHPKIEVVWDCAVEEMLRRRRPAVGHPCAPAQPQDAAPSPRSETDGVFVAIGHKPATELFAGQLDMKPGGYLLTAAGLDRRPTSPASSRPATSTDDVYRQAVTAAGLGCMAALEAERYLAAAGHDASGGRIAAATAWREGRRGLGQDPDLLHRRGSRQLHPRRRRSRPQPVGGEPADQRARARAQGAAVPPPRPRAHPDRAGRSAVPRRPRHAHAPRDHPRPPRRDAASGRPATCKVTTTRRARLDLARAAHRRVPRPLPGRARRADPHQRGARPRHARGRRRDPPAPPGAARPHPAPAVHGAFPRLSPRRTTSSASASRRSLGGPRQAPHRHLRRPPALLSHGRALALDRRARRRATRAPTTASSTTSRR